MTQLEFNTAPPVDTADVDWLVSWLSDKDWNTSWQIVNSPAWLFRFGGPAGADRRVRAIAAESKGQILSYPGSPGYKLTREATIEEIQTATNKLRHQAKEMIGRSVEIERIYHNRCVL